MRCEPANRKKKKATAMIYVYTLAAWGCLVMTSVVIDGIAMYRSLAGYNGEAGLAVTRNAADRAGGVPQWVIRSLMLDILMPWLTFYGLLIAHRDKEVEP
jgi:hypothetical protein